ncbi:MAG: signal peptide peptidase SppA [Alphaproteobacteria bacterium]
MPVADADALIDRRRLKRRLRLWRVFGVLAALLAVYLLVDTDGDLLGRPHVARLWVTGFIDDDAERDEAIARLAKESSVEAVLVRIDSPGGSVGGGEALYRALRALAEKKPTVAVIGSMGTSAAYMAALSAERIFVLDSSITGSIGVIMHAADVTGLLEKLGIKAETIKSRPLKAVPDPFEPLTPEGRAASREVVLDLFDQFVDLVAERRHFDRPRALALADGRVYTGRRAVAEGLVDAVGGERAARAWLAEAHGVDADLRAVDVRSDQRGSWPMAAVRALGKALFSERLRIDGPISIWHPQFSPGG